MREREPVSIVPFHIRNPREIMHSELSDGHGREIRTSYQRNAKGYVNISESDPQGRFVIIENEHRAREEPMNAWTLKRKCDGKHEIVFQFPSDFVLKPRQRIRVWAKDSASDQAESNDFHHPEASNFGTGASIETRLYNADGMERAAYMQRLKTDM